jgi:hypothetical protein
MHQIRGIHPSTKANAATQLYTQHKTFLPHTNNHPCSPPHQKKKQKKKKEPMENTGSIHNCPKKKKKKKRCEKTNPLLRLKFRSFRRNP